MGVPSTENPLSVVRERPTLYYGKERNDPSLPEAVMLYVVADVLRETVTGESLRVELTLVSDTRFEVLDNGQGLPLRLRPSGKPEAMEMLSLLASGGVTTSIARTARGWNLAVATALSEDVHAKINNGDEQLCFRCSWNEEPTLVEEQTEKQGTYLCFALDGTYFTSSVKLHVSNELMETLERMLATSSAETGTQLKVTDARDGKTMIFEKQ